MGLFVVAEGGDAVAAPEHSLAAYAAAARVAEAVGTVVRLTADGVAVVAVAPYFGGRAVHATPYAELVTTAAGPPSLADVVTAIAGDAELEIRLASAEPELLDAVVTALQDTDPDRVLLTSTFAAVLGHAAVAAPDLLRGLLLLPTGAAPAPGAADADGAAVHEAISRARLARADAVHLPVGQLRTYTLTAIDAASLTVHAWGVDTAEAAADVQALGLNRLATARLRVLRPG